MRNKYNFLELREKWIEFFTSKGFDVQSSWFAYKKDEYTTEDSGGCCLVGCKPQMKVQCYFGYYRTNTETGGCIAIDFAKYFNKLSSCPVYFDLLEKEETVWKAIEMLMNVVDSDWYGKIIKQGGGLEFDPPVYNLKERTKKH